LFNHAHEQEKRDERSSHRSTGFWRRCRRLDNALVVGISVGERRYKGITFPLGTLLINVSGAFLMGLLSTLFNVDWKDRYGSNLTALVLTGVLGGYTTFSAYQLDTANLSNKGARGWAAVYWAGSVAAGLIAAALGAITAKLFG
jgi:fluoride exporter